MRRLRSWALGAATALWAAASVAGSASSFFQVSIVLHTGIPEPATDPSVVLPAPIFPTTPPGPGPATPPVGGNIPLPQPTVPGAGGGVPVIPPPGGTAGGATVPPPAVSPPPAATTRPAVSVVQTTPLATGGICTSQTLSGATNATVRVMCSSGQFVSIEPTPGQPFTGTHGGAYRFNFGPGLPLAAGLTGANRLHIGAGTVTALRVMNLDGQATPLEMLVSF